MAGGVFRRGKKGLYTARLQVPIQFQGFLKKTEIWQATGTSDYEDAIEFRIAWKRRKLAEWNAMLAGAASPPAKSRYEIAAELTAARGFTYRTAKELASGPLEDLMSRFTSLETSKEAPGSATVSALLGAVERPKLTITEVAESMPDRFPEDVKYKNERQKNVWRARWTRPAAKFVELLGNDAVFTEIHRVNQALPFRDALRDRIIDGEILGRSAQKEIQLLNLMWEKFHASLGVDEREMPFSPFAGLGKGFSKLDDEEGRKLQVPLDVIEERIVAKGALDFMNPQARDITLALVETGARQSEIADIPPHSIFLDATVPHIWVRRETGIWAREIKNRRSKRKIPLVGVALEAFRRNPEGFPQYRHKGTYSATANKALHAHGALPEDVTIGGLRHSFEARLKDVLAENDDRAELMGHSVKKARGREVYGDEMELRKKLEWHLRIMFKPRQA